MSQSYFQFKQFRVQQERAAMKVSTDACIQGAWTPIATTVRRVLDIGAGTGLLSLMMAQRHPEAVIDAVELDDAASQQATENVAASPFNDRIQVHHADVKDWSPAQPYDLIICNPPFFHNALKGPDAARNAARHSDQLDMATLIRLSKQWLAQDGSASFLWPKAEHALFAAKAEGQELTLQRQLLVRHRAGSAVSRVVSVYTRLEAEAVLEELVIRDDAEAYTERFRQLLGPFYLHL